MRLQSLVLSIALLLAGTVAAAGDDLEGARLALRTRQFAAASRALENLSRAGNPEAQYLLGLASANGLGGAVDLQRAEQQLRSAAQHEHAAAAFALSGLLASREAAKPDEARSWLDRSAALGYAPAVAQQKTGSLPMATRRDPAGRAAGALFELAAWAIREDDGGLLAACGPKALAATSGAFNRTLLHLAALHGAEAAIRLLLASGYRVDARDEFGSTPLMLAAQAGKADAVAQLLAAGAAAELTDKVGRTALFRAAAADSAAAVRRLAAAAKNLDVADMQGWTALDVATQAEKSAAAQALRELGATANLSAVITPRSATGIDPARTGALYRDWPALLVAVSRNDSAQAKRLLAEGARIGALTPQGDNVLHVAVEAEAKDLVPLLLAAGADPRLVNKAGESALRLAVRRNDLGMLAVLLGSEKKAGASPLLSALLLDAVRRGSVESVRGLLAMGASADARDAELGSALLQAVLARHEQLVELLLAAGASPGVADRQGRSVLWHASATGQTRAVQLLIAARASINQGDLQGLTPLAAAAAAGEQSAVASLIEAGANVGARTNSGDTPLYLAAASGQAAVVRMLLRARAGVDIPNKNGDTALIAAARRGSSDVCALLLQNGADARLRNKDRATAKDVAIGRGFAAVARLLESA